MYLQAEILGIKLWSPLMICGRTLGPRLTWMARVTWYSRVYLTMIRGTQLIPRLHSFSSLVEKVPTRIRVSLGWSFD